MWKVSGCRKNTFEFLKLSIMWCEAYVICSEQAKTRRGYPTAKWSSSSSSLKRQRQSFMQCGCWAPTCRLPGPRSGAVFALLCACKGGLSLVLSLNPVWPWLRNPQGLKDHRYRERALLNPCQRSGIIGQGPLRWHCPDRWPEESDNGWRTPRRQITGRS